ncbi:MAG: hypothetical protein QOC83_2883 [Pseudonocardiales bacterium]|jgi:hypothetical protein|nr:hypothetical protein [Pseudonocardiales bacterium]
MRSVRLAVELSPGQNRLLSAWRRDTARELDVPGIARADVLEALLDLLIADDGATGAVRQRLARRLRAERPTR